MNHSTRRIHTALFSLSLLGHSPAFSPGATPSPAPRQSISLNGEWFFQPEGAPANSWKTIQVPSSFEEHEGIEFNGIGIYRKTVDPLAVPEGRRVLLHFQAAATQAEVWWNGQRLGSHLGGWTPFRFDVTELVRQAPAGHPHEVRVRLDEKVGHNTQGFLPIIAPHFGGLWQDVSLQIVAETYLDDLRLMAIGDAERGQLHLELPLAGRIPGKIPALELRCRLRGETIWQSLVPHMTRTGSTLIVKAPVPEFRLWSPFHPNLYEVEMKLTGPGGDEVRTRAAFRSVAVVGPEFRLNGRPWALRGLLNWGYSPPRTQPGPGEASWRQELEMARAHGFNLMKFCLWVPPRRYLELADEMGMLTWMEYPTWHPTLTEQFLDPLRTEFGEFFHYDRNHPSVILRSLTCETGPGADLKVIRELYDLAHAMIPGAVVEDDSSWIGWNRIHDFYDDHPYGNNHDWVATLTRLNDHILAHGLKPLALGEAMAADTWVDRAAILARIGEDRPWWAPGCLDELPRWMQRMQDLAGPGGLASLRADSLRYGLLMRKYQAETYRREVPYGAYVISVIRDIPNASMGLIDYLGQPKWASADWAWQRDTMILLKTDSDARSLAGGTRLQARLLLSHFGPSRLEAGPLRVTLETAGPQVTVLHQIQQDSLQQNPGTLARCLDLDCPLPEVEAPLPVVLRATIAADQETFENHWPLWIVPNPTASFSSAVQVHESLPSTLVKSLLPQAAPFDPGLSRFPVVTARLDEDLVQFLEQGGHVLMLPDGGQRSVPLRAHWFLRGAPYVPDHPLTARANRQLLLDLQHFDLAGDVVPEPSCLSMVDPILMLWDTHDLKTVKTHGLIFETAAARGRLLVSALRHDGPSNAAGRWLLGLLLQHLQDGPPPRHALSEAAWAHLKTSLHAEQIALTERVWQFRPDPDNHGLTEGWAASRLATETEWNPIRIGQAWEAQGYPTLDHWAWYRLTIEIPAPWKGRDIFLSFEGVDDVYELYVNGQLAGQGGDLATRQDAFNERKSHRITDFVTPSKPATLAVRVHDWYGAGGIFRPVTLSTMGFAPELDFLKAAP